MSKKLIMCEGPNEKKIIELLLTFNKLVFDSESLIGLVPYHARQLTSPVITPVLNMYQGDIEIMRIGDKQSDKLVIPHELKNRVKKISKYCTKPELEILLIINEGKYHQFIRSGKSKAKQFAKDNIVFHKRRYDNATSFYDDYYGDRIDCLVCNIREYKKLKKHSPDELFLADLLKDGI